ncbi:hypothetical protein TNCV_728541 [Trichonephila clavipes]|nr:hypothetical protein TNCV_728541 [Trichonephila clavipes]
MSAVTMPRRRIRARFEQMSELERGRWIGLPTGLKFGKHIPMVEEKFTKNAFCGNRFSGGAMGEMFQKHPYGFQVTKNDAYLAV